MVMGTLNDDAKTAITGIWFLTSLTITVALVRLILRIRQYRRLQLDDIVIVFVLLLVIGQAITTMFVVEKAAEFLIFKRAAALLPRHHWWVKQQITELSARVYLAGGLMWVLSLWGFKWCLLIWFSRIAKVNREVERKEGKGKTAAKWHVVMIRVAGTMGGITLACGLAATFLECSPVSQLSDIHADPGSMCAGTNIPVLVTGFSNVFTDVSMLLVSFPLIKRTSHRAPLFFLFFLGLATTASGIVRLRSSLDNPNDLITALWANAEIFCACVVVNVPLIRSAVRDAEGGYLLIEEVRGGEGVVVGG
ncbi:hypothetical protein DFH27DRAFT_633475 [Peziza echinospora]|nr:hypothetical protein DFH27DRAFT_633475 [Peziza echinospora]